MREEGVERHAAAIGDALTEQMQAAVKAYRKGAPMNAAITKSQGALIKALSAQYREVILRFGKATHDAILAGKDFDPVIWEQLVAQFLEREGLRKIALINDATLALLEAVIRRGGAEGLSIPNIARAITEVWPEINLARATRIARTEMIGAANYGSQEGARATGLDLRKRWLATSDDRTRDDHREADGQTVDDLDAPYIVGGEPLRFPGDPNGAPGNIINCRCTEVYEVIE